MEFSAIEVIHVSQLGFIAVAVTPDLPALPPGSAQQAHVIRPDGSLLEASAIVEYRRRPPIKPVLLRFSGLVPSDIPVGSRIVVSQAALGDG